MSIAEAWPPKSAREALLSSPSGRKKAADNGSNLHLSPSRLVSSTPSLLDQLRHARREEKHIRPIDEELVGDDEDDDDEETLQLKLAAIEAKIRLKKLQKGKKDGTPSAASEAGSMLQKPSRANGLPLVEVLLSPSKKQQATTGERSPNRFTLGIDKGARATEISLRRVRTIDGNPLSEHRANSRSIDQCGSRVTLASSAQLKPPAVREIKSFSERMAKSREDDRRAASKRDLAYQTRAKSFKIDHGEILRYKERAVQKAQLTTGSRSQASRLLLGARERNNSSNTNDTLEKDTSARTALENEQKQGDATLFEGFSGLHLSSRILPQSFLKRTLPENQFTIYKIPDLLKVITSPAYELPDETGDFVVFGVVASKSQPLDQKIKSEENTKSTDAWEKKWADGSQNRKKFMAFTITDLKWTIDLYLFDTALPRYHRLDIGTVIAILNPSIMPPKKGRENTGAFSLALHNGDDTILEVGLSQHLGSCKAVRKDGQLCGSWVDISRTEICEFHLNLEIAKTQASRMGVNSGFNGLGGYGRNRGSHKRRGSFDSGPRKSHNGLKRVKEGRGYDVWTDSYYYMTASTRTHKPQQDLSLSYRSDMSAAKMLDLDVDDPFIAEGQISRDRDARLQKRLASQEQERRIARRLAKIDNGGSTGADYLRRKIDADEQESAGSAQEKLSSHLRRSKSNAQTNEKDSLEDLKLKLGRKRAAEDVQLSPVRKKIRFLTSTGIKEAGRESTCNASGDTKRDQVKRTGVPQVYKLNGSNNYDHDKNDKNYDDDDDLDII